MVAELFVIDEHIDGSLGADYFNTAPISIKFKSPELFRKLGDTMVVEYGEFKGNKMLILKRNAEDTYPFQFGKNKAKLIVENYEAIKKFAEEE